MSLSPDEMKALAFKNSKFLRLADGETSKPCKLIECKEVPSKNDPEKNTYRYTLDFKEGGQAVRKFFESSSNGLLSKMADLIGQTIEITRTGVQQNTRYEVEVVVDIE